MHLFTRQEIHLKNESGLALPLVLMIMLILILFGTAAYTASQSSLKQSTNLEKNLECKYLARSAVDATKEAWTSKWIANPETVPTDETFYNKYDATSESFVPATAAEYGNDYVIKTEQVYNSGTGLCTITSTARIGNHSGTVKAVSEKLTNTNVTGIGSDSWYENHKYQTQISFWVPILGDQTVLFDPWYKWSIMPGSVKKTVYDDKGLSYDATYHESEGTVVIQTDSNNTKILYANGTLQEYIQNKTGNTLLGIAENSLKTLFSLFEIVFKPQSLVQLLQKDDTPINYSVTGLQAKRIEFKCPVNLYYNSSVFPDYIPDWARELLALIGLGNLGFIPNPHSLILSAEVIDFNKDLTIGDSSFGNLTISLPPGGGIPGDEIYRAVAKQNAVRKKANNANDPVVDLRLIDKDAKYGIIHFGGTVKTENRTLGQNIPSLLANKTFYFRPMDNQTLSIGTEKTTFTLLYDRFGSIFQLGDLVEDTTFQTLLDKGYLIRASNDSLNRDGTVVFHYE